ncbi:hypothetical protein [Coxiella endosymbiont of Ornithodoros maritimus]|uniref:hypothetical protein n=1 Tax=Coxiella endosymbiont of Ornithodoros maritimus TaxID=1656172 RepID=UPI002B4001CA|nr:hypothetical protein [Coxiella endosymbiont of Ornithodoros maritimus]
MYTASTARLAFAVSEGGYLPSSLRKLNRLGVPHRMILLNFVISLFLFLPFPTWQHMMSFFGIVIGIRLCGRAVIISCIAKNVT